MNNNRDAQRANNCISDVADAANSHDCMYGVYSNARYYTDVDDELKSMLYGCRMDDNKLSDDGRMISANASKLVLDINNNKKEECDVVNSNWRFGSSNIMS